MKQENLEPIGIKERQICFDVLKIIATFAVVMLHVSAQHWFYVKLKTPEWRAFNLYDGSVRFPVPVFVMISGALFLSADRPLRQMYGKYILRIVTAFLFWSVLYAAISYVRGTALIEVLKEAIKGHYHLWYLYMIAGLYVIVPL
ncbi:MAG: acyltransferase family protein, partial [Clostridia bacterium]|nr:acyltransferase family protein [Clostridia bacterium]